jgi:hypothetical protein
MKIHPASRSPRWLGSETLVLQKDPCQTLTMVASDIRQRYAEEIRTNANLISPVLLKAFAAVPRKEFVGSGPWKVLSRMPGQMQPQVDEVTDPAELYHDVAIDQRRCDPSERKLAGQPAARGHSRPAANG